MLLADVAPADVEELDRVGLITPSGHGFRLSGNVGEVAAAGSVASALTEWLRSGPSRQEIADAAPVFVAVLRAAGPNPEALALARAAAPSLLRALRLGAWGQVLHLGCDIATRLGATDSRATSGTRWPCGSCC